VEGIGQCRADQPVRMLRSPEVLDLYQRVEAVLAILRRHSDFQVGEHCTRRSRVIGRILAAAAVHRVVAATAHQRVVTVTAFQPVVSARLSRRLAEDKIRRAGWGLLLGLPDQEVADTVTVDIAG